jgi:uncharacterized membrane protein YidH (DUF202 family)
MSDEEAPVEDEDGDPGLARERTELAWNRSGLAVAVAIAIILRRLWPISSNGAILVLVLIGLGAAVWVIAMRVGRSARVRSPGSGALDESTGRMLMLGTLLLAGGALVVSFL